MNKEKFQRIQSHWLSFNQSANEIANELKRSKNIVAEMSEFYAHTFYGGEKLSVSSKSADIQTKSGTKYQVKGRKIGEKVKSTSLGIIRSWDFDYLTVFLYNNEGEIIRVVEIPSSDAKELSQANQYQSGWVITTNAKFFNHANTKDITDKLKTSLEIK